MIERRQFLKTLGLAGSAAAVDSCAQPGSEQLIPYFLGPDAVTTGERAYYATTCRGCPAGCGMIAAAVNGRVTKVEGNPDHPIGRGRLCARGQGLVHSIYHPHRFRGPLRRDAHGTLQPLSWGDAEQFLAARLAAAKQRGPNRIAWVGRLETGPFDDLVTTWLAAFGSTRRMAFETFEYGALRRAAHLAFGRAEVPHYDLEKADFVLAFGAEFLETWLSNVEFTGAYARLRARRAHDADGSFACVAPRLSLTGLNADAWLPAPPGAEPAIACAIANVMMTDSRTASASKAVPAPVRAALDRFTPERVRAGYGIPAESIREIARRFARATSPVALGGGVSGEGVDALALETAVFVLNALSGAVGTVVTFGDGSVLDRLATRDSLAQLAAAMRNGDIDVLFTHHANPVFGLPPSVGFADAIGRVPLVVSFDTLQDETTDRAHLVLPDHHDLEAWGAYAPRSSTIGVMQPAAAPLFDTRATGDVLVEVAQQANAQAAGAVGAAPWRDRVQRWWNGSWDEAARHGGRFEDEPSVATVSLADVSAALAAIPIDRIDDGLTLVAYPTSQFFDGRHADVSWLQELPDPVTKIVWANAAELHPDTANGLGIGDGDTIELASPHGRISARALVHAAVHPAAVALPIGYGRTASMRTAAAARGPNVMQLLPAGDATAIWQVRVTVRRVGGGGRRLTVLQSETAAAADPKRADAQIVRPDRLDVREPPPVPPAQFYPEHDHPQHRWGMAIDLNACTGCSACVVACYAENNVAVVGAQFCEQGREMSWIRIEREVHEVAAVNGVRAPASVFLPMLCQQCDNAPCEAVCPVYATYHNPEGLNAQVYPRCVGTRFCSNNCPYKVRRFNWARYGWEAPLTEQLNPDVTVRSVGVMEKCTFCVQRIQGGKRQAARESRPLRGDDIVPACAQTCPADAIVFGDLRDPRSRVSQLAAAARGYHVLEELNMRPAITYLRRVVPGAPEHAG